MLRSALKKRQVVTTIDDGESKIVNCLRNTLTTTSNVLLINCVNPGQVYYEHSLPAIKFCARIRDCIIKKLGAKSTSRHYASNTSMEEISYNLDTDRVGSSHNTAKQVIEHLKEEIANKQYAVSAGELVDRFELDRWTHDKLDTIERLISRTRTQDSSDRQSYIIIDELIYLKEKLVRLQH
jgi:anti-sigma28 factor (negative regulator of flagellin synthesis)